MIGKAQPMKPYDELTPQQQKRRRHYMAHQQQVLDKSRAWYRANRQRAIDRNVAYKRGVKLFPRNSVDATCHPEAPHFAKGMCKPCYYKDNYRNNKDQWRRAYGYQPGDFDRMLAEQGGRCYLCDEEVFLVADHDHETGLPRRPICGPCNNAIGMLHDDPELLAKAAQYIAGFKPLAVAYQ